MSLGISRTRWIDYAKEHVPGGAATFIVAASDSLHKERADYVADGVDDQVEIQAAIDALPASSGKVVLSEGRHHWSSQPTLADNIMIEGQGPGTVIELEADIVPFSIHNITRCHVRNLDVEVTDGHTEAILEMLADGTGGVTYCSYGNINIRNPYSAHGFTGIRLKMDDDRFMYENQFKQIYMGECNKGIHICGLSDDVWANGNLFEKIFAHGFVIFVDFDGTATKTNLANKNTFIDVRAQTNSYSTDGFKGIYRRNNIFYGCHIWDWSNASSPNYDWSVDSDAINTLISGTNTDPSSGTVNDASPSTTWLSAGIKYPGYSEIRTVTPDADTGGDYTKLSDAFADITDASASKRYIIQVFGHVDDDTNFSAKSYIGVVGFNAEIEFTIPDGTNINFDGISNAVWRNIILKKTGTATASGCVANFANVSDDIKMVNIEFSNETSDNNYQSGVGIRNSSNARFENCIASGGATGSSSAGWYIAPGDSAANPILVDCKGEGGADGGSGFSVRQLGEPIFQGVRPDGGFEVRHHAQLRFMAGGEILIWKVVNYDDSSPVTVCDVEDGYAVTDVWVEIVIIFDDTGPQTLDIGDGGDTDGFLANANINVGAAGYYGIEYDNRGAYLWDAANAHARTKVYTGADTIDCTIGAGAGDGTQGQAIVYAKVTRIGG